MVGPSAEVIVYHEAWSSDFLPSFPPDDGDRCKLGKVVFFFKDWYSVKCPKYQTRLLQ